MEARIVDTTLRDGEQQAGVALGVNEKVRIARLLDELEIFQIEAGIPAMGGLEKKSIEKIIGLGLKSRISVWNRMNINDIQSSLECGADFLHISVPASDIQIKTKLNKTREWIITNLKKSISYALEKGARVTVGMEDSSRADKDFLRIIIAEAKREGAERIRYADTVGILYRKRIYEEIKELKESSGMEFEIHAHNDLGMAVANTLAAVDAGVEYVNCTFGGIGERSGNCNYLQYIEAAKGIMNLYGNFSIEKTKKAEKEILKLISGSS